MNQFKAISVATLSLVSALSFADLTAVMKVDSNTNSAVTGSAQMSPHGEYKIAVHGYLVRIDSPDGTYAIIDVGKRRVSEVNPALKTVSYQGLGDFEKGGPSPIRGRDISGSANIQDPASLDAKPIAGCPAKNIDFNGTASIAVPVVKPSKGGRRRGGNIPTPGAPGSGGADNTPAPQDHSKDSQSMQVTGTVWGTPVNPFGSDGDREDLAFLAICFPRRAVVGALWDKLKEARSMPLALTATITSSDSSDNSIQVTAQILSLKWDAIDPAVFLVPSDFGKVDPAKSLLSLLSS